MLTEHQQAFIKSLVGTRRHQSASEVLGEGLRLIEQRVINETVKLQALQRAHKSAWMPHAAGRYIEVKDEEDAKALRAGIDAQVTSAGDQLIQRDGGIGQPRWFETLSQKRA